MSSRLRRLATDWKTYLGLLAAGSAFLVELTGFIDNVKDILKGLGIPAWAAEWAILGSLSFLALLALWAALTRRSILLRPERFLISAEDPRHLVGREDRVARLAEECEKNSLVILKGESGAGKSALVQAGLLPYLDPTRPGNQARRLLLLRIDAAGLDWDEGLKTELARSLARLSAEERALLGAAAPLASEDTVFSWLSELPGVVPKRLLLVLDQMDDYFVAHWDHFVTAAGDVVAKPEELEQVNPDWRALAVLVRQKRLHLLLVCRNDADVLSALHLKQPTTFLLMRIAENLISPLLDEITRPDDKGEVVDDPDAGWVQLKSRLLRDLASGGSILPVQLALALDSLRTFRYLTIAEYAKQGSARGLDRLHVERHLRDVARALGLNECLLLQALVLLTTEDGSKTQRVSLSDFAATLSAGLDVSVDMETLVEHLEQFRILRQQSGKEGSYLLLYHDYLARGVREAYRQANRWVELLRLKGREFEEALNWRQHWQALLPLSAQGRLLIVRRSPSFGVLESPPARAAHSGADTRRLVQRMDRRDASGTGGCQST